MQRLHVFNCSRACVLHSMLVLVACLPLAAAAVALRGLAAAAAAAV
jgi:hypothetical protein